jgi:phage shock protein E
MNDVISYVLLAAAAAFLIYRRFGGAKKMSSAAIKEKIQAGARIIDVRTPDEFADGSYPKAKNIPLNSLPARVGELEPKDKPIVVFCASGARSASAARLLQKAGFTDVVNAGGLEDMPK